MKNFHRSFRLGFLTVAVTAVCVVDLIENRYLELLSLPLELPVSQRLVNRKAWYPGLAKRMRLFWVSGAFSDGAGVKLFDDAALFESVFPGYAAAIPDRPLWDRYFRQPFHSAYFNPFLSRPGRGVKVWNSWTGNLDLFSRYGADIVILGNSESQALSPGFLHELFATSGPALRDAKILPFSTGGMSSAEMVLALQAMKASGRKARMAVLGYSILFLPPGGDAPAENQNVEVFGKWRGRNTWFWAKWESVLRLLNWNKIVWLNRAVLDRVMGDKAYSRRIDDFTVHKGAIEMGWAFPDRLVGNEAALEKIAAATPVYRSLQDSFGTDCDLTKAAASLDRVLAGMQDVAPRVIVYLTPTTPLQRQAVPRCIVDGVHQMLRARANARVSIETGDWESYGLDYRDYVDPSERDGFSCIDLNHTNLSGSQKIVSKIGKIILRALAAPDQRARKPSKKRSADHP